MNENLYVKVLDEKWDYLIILDTCRFDYFEKLYRDFFTDGVLSKRISLGSNTNEWLMKNFVRKSDIIYISANPKVSSTRPVSKFRASELFETVYDIWHTDWDDNFHTVKPDVMTRQSLNIIFNHSGKRTIIHYMQPHAPYLTYKDPDNFKHVIRKKTIKRRFYIALNHLFSFLGIKVLATRWKILETIGIKPTDYMYWMKIRLGDEGLRKCYEKDVRTVLAEVKKLIEYLDGTIVVTADHGDMLGEKGLYAHWPGSKEPILKEVPWFVIENNKSKDIESNEKAIKPTETGKDVSKEEIEKKLSLLGY